MDITTTRWTVEVQLGERDGRTHARATLETGLAPPLVASGDARFSPHDPVDVAEIGYELAAARALTRLARQLMDLADADVEALVHDLRHG